MRGAGDAEHEVLPGTLPAKPPQGPPGQLPPPPTLTEAEAKRMRRAQKKAAKEARRAEKKVQCTSAISTPCNMIALACLLCNCPSVCKVFWRRDSASILVEREWLMMRPHADPGM